MYVVKSTMSGFRNASSTRTTFNYSTRDKGDEPVPRRGKDRSDSSASLREQLKRNYVVTPEITPKISFFNYMNFARNMYYSAIDALKKRPPNLEICYVELHKFIFFAAQKLPEHPQYSSQVPKARDCRGWVKQALPSALAMLEDVVARLDAEEDFRLRHQVDLQLIDAFDEDDGFDGGNGVACAAHQQVPMGATSATAPSSMVASIDQPLFPSPDLAQLASISVADTPTALAPTNAASANESRDLSRLAILSLPTDDAHAQLQQQTSVVYATVPDISYGKDDDGDGKASSGSGGGDSTAAVALGSLVSVSTVDVEMLRCIGDFYR